MPHGPAAAPVPALLERDDELRRFAAALDAARHGRGRVLLVEGAAGLGKSCLLDALAAAAGDARVLRARGIELERGFPFGVTVQLFDGPLRAASGEERRAVLSGAAGLAAPLFAGGPDEAAQRSSPFSLLHGLYWMVANLADRAPLVLLVDDAHWADHPSLRFLCYLGERLDGLRALVVVAHRPGPAGEAGELLGGLAGGPHATHLGLRPLGARSVAALVHRRYRGDTAPDEGFTAACHEATGGNPLLLRELLAALDEEGAAPGTASASRAREIGPRSVWRSLELQLARLGEQARRVAEAAAVLGDDTQLPDVAALAGLAPGEASAAVAALERSGVLAGGTAVSFAHPILRQAVLEQSSPTSRAADHRTAARLLYGRGDVERVAAHLLLGRVDREPWAVEVLRAAADRALAAGDPGAAVRLLDRAREEARDPVERAELALACGRAAVLGGRADAPELLERALAQHRDPRGRAEVLLELGRAHHGVGAPAAAMRAYGDGLAVLDAAPEAAGERPELRLELECGYVAAGVWEATEGLAVADRIGALLETGHEPRVPAERSLMALLGASEALRGGDRALAVDLAHRAWGDGRYVAELGPDDPGLSSITGVLIPADCWEQVEEVCDAALAAARAIGSLTAHASISYTRGVARYFTGRLPDALSDLEIAREAEAQGWRQNLSANRWMLATAALACGDLERARSAVVLTPEDEARARESTAIAALLVARGLVALEDGDAREALARFEESGHLQEEVIGVRNPAVLGYRVNVAWALARLGDLAGARRAAEEDLERTAAWGAPRAWSVSLRTLGLVAEDPRRRLELLGDAVDVVAGTGALLEEARARHALGTALRREGRRASAQETLRGALDLADRCGAAPLAARAREELTAAGGRPRRARLSGPGALTPAERRVARLAADGLTNREIAEALFVTRKAVEFHLGNVYRKLGVRRRGDLAEHLGPDAPEVDRATA